MNVQRMAVRTAALLILSGSAITSIWGQPGNQNTPDSPGGMPAGMSPGGGPGPSAKINYTPAIYVDEGVYVPEKSVAASLSGGKVGNTSASGVKITSKADSFNGIYVKGSKSVFTLSDSTIELYGNGVNHADNYGAGAGAVAGSGGTLILKNVKITTNGLGSCTATSTDKGILKVYDSTLIANGGILPPGSPAPGTSPLAWGPPAPLGIGGNARASNTTSGSKSYFYNSTIIAEEWGALSTDETGGGVYLEANNCDIRTIKNGYGTYADGGATVVINDSKMSTATYLAIIAGPGKVTLNNVNATSGGNAVMLHNVGGNPAEVGVLEIKGGKIVTQKPVILVRSASPEITIDGTELASTSGVLIQSVINPDPHAARVKGQTVSPVKVTLKKMKLEGNILHEDTERGMSVALLNTTLKGTVKGASLSLDAGSKWTATGDSRVTLVGNVEVASIDASVGVTITAAAGRDCSLKGNYNLASGGVLNVDANLPAKLARDTAMQSRY